MNDIHFHQITIAGYRGRNFMLKMNPRGKHTVFIMDGNTGKTTTIELLRWCFRFKQSEAQAEHKFEHMWYKPAHVLDDTKKGPQTCEIAVHFTALDDEDNEHFFQLKRITEGEFDLSYPPVGDKINSISDTLEIDHGSRVLQGDEVNDYLSLEFRFDECAEYFCFDGEKAREVMQLASDSGKIDLLLNLVNRRTTHPVLEEYKRRLDELREQVLAEAKAKITEKALQISMGKLAGKIRELRQTEKNLEEIKRQIDWNSLAEKQLRERLKQLDDHITSAKAGNVIERNKYELEQKNIRREVAEKRLSVYKDNMKWVLADIADAVNQIKSQVKEKGRLPEPYRKELIKSCKESGLCEICGRPLDAASRKRIESLERQVAPHEVQVFLSEDFSIPTSTFNPKAENNSIKQLIEKHRELDEKISSIKLSEKDAKLIGERDSLDPQIDALKGKIAGLNADADALKELVEGLRKEVKDLQGKNAALAENKIILDKIDESIQIVDGAAEKIKVRATEIISKVISEGVTSVLGGKFSAKLSQTDGLMLGEDGFYGKEKGGYSGRLILSYCFAEAMTFIDPIVVDTPVGNIGSQREKLAAHLSANHKQVILLCLPTEINNFAPLISPKLIEIKNQKR